MTPLEGFVGHAVFMRVHDSRRRAMFMRRRWFIVTISGAAESADRNADVAFCEGNVERFARTVERKQQR